MKCLAMLLLVATLAGCAKSHSSASGNRGARSPGYIEEQPHIITGTGAASAAGRPEPAGANQQITIRHASMLCLGSSDTRECEE